jgi:hypothetical protein
MLLKLLKAAFGGRAREAGAPAPILYSGPRHRGFIGFVADVEGAQFLAPGESVIAVQASLRLRVGIPAKVLQRYAPVCLFPMDLIERDPTLQALGEPRAVVVGKFPVRRIAAEPARFAALIAWTEEAQRRHPVVADLSDDLAAAATMYQLPWLAEFQQQLAKACPLSVPSTALRERIGAVAAHSVTVIEDPFEREVAAPARFAPGEILRLAWFGVFGPPLRAFIEGHFSGIARRLAPRALEIVFVTEPGQAELVAEMGASLRETHPGCSLRFVPWSSEAVAREVTNADLVVLPQDAATDWGRVKSHNRLVEALRGGRFAVASPIPAYQELAGCAWVGEDLADGVEWALAHPGEVLRRIAAGQALVEQRFSPERIGELWANLLGLAKTR